MRYYSYPEQTISTAGLASDANQLLILAELQALNLVDYATEAKQDDILNEIQITNAIDFATEAKQDDIISELSSLNLIDYATEAKQDDIITELQSLVANTGLTIVDQIDTTPLLSVALTNIPASASNPVEIVASLAANVKKVVSVEDIGEYIGLYTGLAAAEVLACVLPLGGGEVEVEIPAGTRISLRHMKNTAITSDYIAINFLG